MKKSLEIILFGAAMVGMGVTAFVPLSLKAKYNKHTKLNLAPHAIHMRNSLGGIPSSTFPIDSYVMDVNGDGNYESVLAYKNPTTGEIEMRLVEQYGNEIKIRKYEVVNGEIKYLPE